MYIVLKNDKYSKLLFLNTLRYNYLPIKTNKNKIMFFFFNTRLASIIFDFIFVEVRAFTLVVLKILVFSTSKNYFINFTTSFYNTPNIKCSIFLNNFI